jgi:hypothetical protein
MISLLHYLTAVQRLKESEKTIQAMGGVSECNDMLLAQHEMIQLEKEFYRDEVKALTIYIGVLFVLIIGSWALYMEWFQ